MGRINVASVVDTDVWLLFGVCAIGNLVGLAGYCMMGGVVLAIAIESHNIQAVERVQQVRPS